MPASTQTATDLSAGGRLVAADGRTLPLRATHLDATAGGGLARTRLEQRFANPYAEPLTVTYLLPLPADGAVAGFTFTIGARRVTGEIDRRAAARERFERALVEGRTATLLEQDRAALFHQEIGNIPPGVEVVAEIVVDQPLAWDSGGWEYRFPTAVAPRYLGAAGRVADAERAVVDVADAPLPGRLTLALRIDDLLARGGVVESSSHALQVRPERMGERGGWCGTAWIDERERRGGPATRVTFAGEAPVRLDRDVVVCWPVAGDGAVLTTARANAGHPHAGDAFGLLTLVPPAIPSRRLARDLIVLFDTSGSMAGEPLAQAKAVVAALIGSLGDADRLELIAFSSAPREWLGRAVPADEANRRAAIGWLRGLDAGGGTEMRAGLRAALRPLRADSQRQVLLVSDGQIGFEQEIVAELLRGLPAGCRLHVLGVGSAPNRSLTCAGARAGRGVEVLVGLGESPEFATRRLLSALAQPVVVDLEVEGDAVLECAPARLPDLLAGAPARVSLRLRPQGGELRVRGRAADGTFARTLHVPATEPGGGRPEISTRFGRELVEDLEMQLAAGGDAGLLDRRIEELGLRFGLATRLTSWVAIATEPGVDPGAPQRREVIPHELPYGMSVEGLGLRPACAAPAGVLYSMGIAGEAGVVDAVVRAVPRDAIRGPGRKARDAGPPRVGERAPDEPPSDAAGARFPPHAVLGAAAPHVGADRIAVLVLRSVRDGAGEEFVFELTGNEAAWRLPQRATLRWADGTECAAIVVAERSTRPGPFAAGAVGPGPLGGGLVTVRLALAVAQAPPQDVPAVLVLDGESFAVRLVRARP